MDGGISDTMLYALEMPVQHHQPLLDQQETAQQQLERQHFAAPAAAAAAPPPPVVAAAGAAAQQLQQQQMQALLRRGAAIAARRTQERSVIANLKAKYKGRQGTYSKADQLLKRAADDALQHLERGILPEEVVKRPRLSDAEVLERVQADSSIAARVADAAPRAAGRYVSLALVCRCQAKKKCRRSRVCVLCHILDACGRLHRSSIRTLKPTAAAAAAALTNSALYNLCCRPLHGIMLQHTDSDARSANRSSVGALPLGGPQGELATTAPLPALPPAPAAADVDAESEVDPQSEDDSDADISAAEREQIGPSYHSVGKHQQGFIAMCLAKVRNGGLRRLACFTFRPDNATMASGHGGVASYCTLPTHFWAPHATFAGIPSQPPCPTHGWAAVEQGAVEQRGWIQASKARRISGISRDEFLMGTEHICRLCKSAKRQALWWAAAACTEQERVARTADAKQQHHCFRSYDPAVTKWYLERYPWIGAQVPAVITSQRTALTHDLSQLIQWLCPSSNGGNPTDIAKMLKVMRAHRFDRSRAVYYGHQAWLGNTRHASAAAAMAANSTREQQHQLSIQEAFARGSHAQPAEAAPAEAGVLPATPFVHLTEELYGFSSPGDALVRRFNKDMAAAKELFRFSWRQQFIGGHIVQADHTLKASRGCNVWGVKMFNKRATLWSATLNCPLLCLNVESTSFDDGALALGASALMDVYKDGRAPITLAYIDNPHRDEKGLIRRIPTLARSSSSRY